MKPRTNEKLQKLSKLLPKGLSSHSESEKEEKLIRESEPGKERQKVTEPKSTETFSKHGLFNFDHKKSKKHKSRINTRKHLSDPNTRISKSGFTSEELEEIPLIAIENHSNANYTIKLTQDNSSPRISLVNTSGEDIKDESLEELHLEIEYLNQLQEIKIHLLSIKSKINAINTTDEAEKNVYLEMLAALTAEYNVLKKIIRNEIHKDSARYHKLNNMLPLLLNLALATEKYITEGNLGELDFIQAQIVSPENIYIDKHRDGFFNSVNYYADNPQFVKTDSRTHLITLNTACEKIRKLLPQRRELSGSI